MDAVMKKQSGGRRLVGEVYCERCEGYIGPRKCKGHLWRVDLADGSSFLSHDRSTVERFARDEWENGGNKKKHRRY